MPFKGIRSRALLQVQLIKSEAFMDLKILRLLMKSRSLMRARYSKSGETRERGMAISMV